mmetsp:Transcript_4765/g.15100  ORF Transcript_4765/g.15100 Transcript_4765/m.15100 type:complete len:140 (+) Transcript_4765:118-537(+)
MFGRVASRSAIALRGVRQASTKAQQLPRAGLSEGAHPNVLQTENLRENFFNFRKTPEVVILVVIVGGACGMAAWKLFGSDAAAPETTWMPETRRSFEKRLLERPAQDAWENGSWHKGPFARNREVLGIIPSDPKLDYKN